jgi:hypothetical protein
MRGNSKCGHLEQHTQEQTKSNKEKATTYKLQIETTNLTKQRKK